MKKFLNLLIEMGFIIFLFYANLLMGEYTKTSQGSQRGLLWSLNVVFTWENFIIALIAAFWGYVIFEFLRRRLIVVRPSSHPYTELLIGFSGDGRIRSSSRDGASLLSTRSKPSLYDLSSFPVVLRTRSSRSIHSARAA